MNRAEAGEYPRRGHSPPLAPYMSDAVLGTVCLDKSGTYRPLYITPVGAWIDFLRHLPEWLLFYKYRLLINIAPGREDMSKSVRLLTKNARGYLRAAAGSKIRTVTPSPGALLTVRLPPAMASRAPCVIRPPPVPVVELCTDVIPTPSSATITSKLGSQAALKVRSRRRCTSVPRA